MRGRPDLHDSSGIVGHLPIVDYRDGGWPDRETVVILAKVSRPSTTWEGRLRAVRGTGRGRPLVAAGAVVAFAVVGLGTAAAFRARSDAAERAFLATVGRAAAAGARDGGMAAAATPERLAPVLGGAYLVSVGPSAGPREVAFGVSGDRLGLALRGRYGNCELAEAASGRPVRTWAVRRDLGAGCTGQLALGGPDAVAPQTAPVRYRTGHGDLRRLVLDFAAQVPAANSEGYAGPSRDQRATFLLALAAARAGDLDAAADRLRPLGRQLVRYVDAGTGRTAVLLADPPGGGGRGWGLYAVVPGSPSAVVVQVPHPVADRHTEEVGVDMFRSADASALLVAGANRDADRDGAADVAHNEDSIFEAVSAALVVRGSRVVQPHGFSETGHPTYGDAVVSAGVAPASSLVRAVADALVAAGFRTCLYDGRTCRSLAATRNVQGRSTRAAGGEFVHLEIADAVRADDGRRRQLAETVAAVLAGS